MFATTYRTHYDLLIQIVETCLQPIGKTDLYYTVKTSYNAFGKQLDTALRFKLIENIGNQYQTTERGKAFLIEWEHVQALLKEE